MAGCTCQRSECITVFLDHKTRRFNVEKVLSLLSNKMFQDRKISLTWLLFSSMYSNMKWHTPFPWNMSGAPTTWWCAISSSALCSSIHFHMSTRAFPSEWKHVATVVHVQIVKITSLPALGGKDRQDIFVLPLLCSDCAQTCSFSMQYLNVGVWLQWRKKHAASVFHMWVVAFQQAVSASKPLLPTFVWEQPWDIFITGGGILVLVLACWHASAGERKDVTTVF